MDLLTLAEELAMLAILKLNDDAYGVPIREAVIEMTGKKVVYGTLYNTLNQLVRKGFVITERGAPTPERGGRSKVFYRLTKLGKEALMHTRSRRQLIWQGVPDFS